MTDTPASLAALGIKPVAWLYVHEFSTGTRHSVVCPQSERMESPESRGWTETPLYSATDLAPLIAKARRVEELEAENARLRGMMKPQWFYLGDDQSSDQCRFSLHEVIDEDFFGWGERKEAGQHVVHISTAMPGPDIWAVVSVLTEAEKDARDDDEPWLIEEYGTEAEARAALKENTAETEALAHHREADRLALVAEIVAELRAGDRGYWTWRDKAADHIEAKFGGGNNGDR